MKKILFAVYVLVITLIIGGCGAGGEIAGGCKTGNKLKFTIASVKDGLPLDSLLIKIKIGNDTNSQKFSSNLKTGISSASITAAEGDAYKLTFELFSAGLKIGAGQDSGKLTCDLNVTLNPKWDTAKTEQAKNNLNRGLLLPSKLAEHFSQALPGKYLELPLDTTHVYRWYVKLNDSTIIEDTGKVVRILIPDSLAGKTITLRLQVLSGNTIVEDRIWSISILSTVSKDILSRILIRTDTNWSDTNVNHGTASAYRYDKGHLIAIENFPTLNSNSGISSVSAESLFYDDASHLTRTSFYTASGGKRDSLFSYNAEGLLIALESHPGTDKIIDSLWYDKSKLSRSTRTVNGKQTEFAIYTWTNTNKRVDSVYTNSNNGIELFRIIQNIYKNGNLIERDISGGINANEPMTKEFIIYNALGSQAYHEYYTEGAPSVLEVTETYKYDAKGRMVFLIVKDEVTGDIVNAYSYEYSAALAKFSAYAYSTRVSADSGMRNVLQDIFTAHSDLKFSRKHRSLEIGR